MIEADLAHAQVFNATVLVVGGYGAVGALLSKELARQKGVKVIPAGRSVQQAQQLAAEIGTEGRCIDLARPSTWEEALTGVTCVVVCIDQDDTRFVEFVLQRGAHYIDLTANDRLHRAVEQLRPLRSAIMLSVGLAPGLTNILAAYCVDQLDTTERVDIGILAGLGDKHGRAGLRWLADQMFDRERDGWPSPIRFGFAQGIRASYAMGFSDQYALLRTLPIEAAVTRLALESKFATWALFTVSRLFAGNKVARRIMLWIFGRLHLGTTMCNISVHAYGTRNGRPATSSADFASSVETETTARLAAYQIQYFLEHAPADGIWHSHQLLGAQDLIRAIAECGLGTMQIEPALDLIVNQEE